MAQTSRINDDRIWPALEKSLDILGSSKDLVLYHLSKMSTDLSSIEEVEQVMTRLLGEGAQIIIVRIREQLKNNF